LVSTSAFCTCLKGSTTHNWTRIRTLQRISTIVQKTGFLAFLQLINTRHHPADIPSRKVYKLQPATPEVLAKLAYIKTHPTLLHLEPLKHDPDCSRDAWSTPPWVRWIVLKSSNPPNFDLFADKTNSLSLHHFDLQNPFNPNVLQAHWTCFFQPPYQLLTAAWDACQPFLPPKAGLWGLVPKSFFLQKILPTGPGHLCFKHMQVDYQHPTLKGTRAKFKSTLFYMPAAVLRTSLPTQPPPDCHCHYIHNSPPHTTTTHNH